MMADINDVFKKDMACCGLANLTSGELFLSAIYKSLLPCLQKYLNKVTAAELYGQPTKKHYDRLMDIHYFVAVIMFAWDEYGVIYLNDEIDENTEDYIWEKYNIECYKTYFDCIGCGTLVRKNFFDQIKNIIHQYITDGIGSMQITPNDALHPIFRVRT